MSEDTRFEELYRATMPSVVSLYLTADRPGGAGSGFVVDEDGHIVTNEHVVGRSAEVDVRFSDGSWRVGRVVGTDAYTDLAVVRVDDLPGNAAPLAFAEATPTPGTRVAAFGNPMGLDGTITTGIVSGANRSMYTQEGFAIPDTVQTDAAINPGNSGGPLVTLAGAVVGVNRARGGDNIGFAVSADIARKVVPALVADGAYRHSYLRIRTLDVSPTVATANRIDEASGVLVVDVDDGPASGVLRGCSETRVVRGREVPVGGDVITHIDGVAVDSHEQLMRHLIVETDPGDEVAVALVRRGKTVEETLTLAERPQPSQRQRGRWGRRRESPQPRGPKGRGHGPKGRRNRDRDGGTDIPVR